MRLLVDENMPRSAIIELRNRGHDVLSAKESLRGLDDEMILAQAQADARTVVTCDKDFGELAFQIGLPSSCGVILVRMPKSDPSDLTERVIEVIESRSDWSGAFAVATAKRLRVRPLPVSE